MKIVALTGPKGSGKDTVADIICNRFKHVKRVAFADPIKTVVQHIFRLDTTSNAQYDRLKRSKLEAYGGDFQTTWKSIEGRHVVREIGMLMRSYDTNQFTKYVEDEIVKAMGESEIFVVTDLRFENEYEMLKFHNAKVVKIERPNYYYDGHVTERGFDNTLVDIIINNDGSLEALEDQVMSIFKE